MTTKKQQLLGIIEHQLNPHPDLLTEEAYFIQDLGADSIDILEMTFEIENEFPVNFSDDDVAKFRTVGDLVSFMESKGLLED